MSKSPRIGTAYVEVGGDFSKLREQLAAFRDRGVSVNVTADINTASFANAKRAAGSLGGKEEVKLKADVDVSSFARARAATAVLVKESDKLGDTFNRSKLSIRQSVTVMAALAPVALDVAGALGALTSSLGAATLGLGALGVGLASVATVGFGGIAAIAVPAIKSLGEVITAQTALNKARSTGAASAASSAASSAQQITAAENSLANAQRSEKVAQDALNTAREEAVRQLQDMKRAALESGTSEKRARLSLQQAEANLRKLRREGGGSALDIRDAELSVVEARQNVKDVSIQAERAQQDYNKAQKGGISKMDGVVSAQRAYADAQRATAEAQRGVTQAQREANAATGAGATQLAALQLAQKKAGPAAVKFAAGLKDLTQRWRRLTVAGREDFFGALSDGVDRLNTKLPMLAKSANTSMKALRAGFDDFLKKATGPEFDKFIDVMTRTFAKSIGPVSRGFGNIAKVLERIAVAVAPDIVRMAHAFEGMTEGWVKDTKNAGDLRDTVHDLVKQTEAWWDLLVAAKDLVVAVLVPGMDEGKNAVKDMTGQLKEWTSWAQKHPSEIRDFMKEGLETTKKLAEALLSFLPTLFEISKGARPIARFLLGALKALNSIKIGNVSAVTVLIGLLVSKKIINGVLGIRDAFLALRTAALGATTAEIAAARAATAAGVGSGAAAARGATGGVALSAAQRGTLGGGVLAAESAAGAGAGVATGKAFMGGWRGVLFGPIGIAATIVAAGTFGHILNDVEHDAEGAAQKWKDKFIRPIQDSIRNLNLTRLTQLNDKLQETLAWYRQQGQEVPAHIRKTANAVDKALGSITKSYGRWQNTVSELRHMIFRNMGDIVDKTREALQDINRIEGISNKRRNELVVASYNAEVATIRKSMKQGLIEHREGHQKILEIQRKILKAYGVKDVQRLIVSDQVLAGATRIHKQRGGHIGGSGVGDTVPAMLEPGEFVVNKKATAAARRPLEELNKRVPRFQTGGIVDRTGVQHFQAGGYVGMQPGIVKLIKTLIARFGGYMSSGLRPGDDGFHGRGLAGDWVGGDWTGASRYVNTIGPSLLEGIHQAPPGRNVSWDSGKQVPPSFWGAGTWADHVSHIHVAIGKAIKGALGRVPKIKFPRFKATALAATGTAASLNTIAGVAELAIENATRHARVGLEAMAGMKGPWVKVMKRIAAQRNWSFSDWMKLVQGESGGDPTAVNPSSGAFGLGQFLGATKAAYAKYGAASTDPARQIMAMAKYISDRYGNPTRAYQTWLSRSPHWYREGGMVPFGGHFDHGGVVPGREGQPVPIIAHGGETVVPKFQKGGLVKGLDLPGKESRGLGLERAIKIRKHIGDLLRRVAKFDELIDITERLAGLTTSPGGSESTTSEITKQLKLQQKLLAILQRTFQTAKRGVALTTKGIDRIEDRTKRLGRLIKHEQRRERPDREKLVKWQAELRKKTAVEARLKALGPGFRQQITDLSGVTGQGGRIFDTKLAIKELKASALPQPLHLAELLEFAEALRFGAFKRPSDTIGPLPTFATGGIVPGRIGQAIPVIAHGGERFHGAGGINLEAHIWVGNQEIKDITRVEIKEHDRQRTRGYRAGVN